MIAVASLVLGLMSIPTSIIVPLGAILAFAGSICGIIAIARIARSRGRLRGTWMAIFSCIMFALNYVALLLLLVAVA